MKALIGEDDFMGDPGEGVAAGLARLDERVKGLDGKLDAAVKGLDGKIGELRTDVRGLDKNVGQLDAKFDAKFDRLQTQMLQGAVGIVVAVVGTMVGAAKMGLLGG